MSMDMVDTRAEAIVVTTGAVAVVVTEEAAVAVVETTEDSLEPDGYRESKK